VCDRAGTCVGLVVAREIFVRVGARTRPLVAEGAAVEPAQAVAELGGPLAAIRGAAPLALTWLHRLSAVASGATPPEPDNELDAYAARLSAPAAVGHDGPSFHVEFEG
jgi:Quinolinate phosphoribosyl transferase, N-terminal domain